MEKTFIGVRDVDVEAFRKFRELAVQRKLKLGDAFKEAVTIWEKEETKMRPNIRNLLKMKKIKVGRKVRWSEEIDEILYTVKK